MKIAVLTSLALLASCSAFAQTDTQIPPPADVKKDVQIDIKNPIKAEGVVPVSGEPHHVLVFKNDFVHVYNVTVPPLDVTLMHQHDLPYLYLTLGMTDIMNAVQGKPEAHLVYEDGTTRYSPGSFAHIVRTDAGILFHNITIELAHPQASPHNLGEKGDPALGACPQNAGDAKSYGQVPSEQLTTCFETDEVRMDIVRVEGGKDYEETAPKLATLVVAMSNANLDVSLTGEHSAFLHAGDVLWLPAGTPRRIVDFLGIKSKFLLISFKDSGTPAAK